MFDRIDVLVCPPTLPRAGHADHHRHAQVQLLSCAGASRPLLAGGDRMRRHSSGRRGRDAMLLRTAEWCERSLAFNAGPPLLQT